MKTEKHNSPLVSIIIPVYKTELFITQCLESIIQQTYTNWEAILVDDGSPDNAGRICDEYATKDNRFKVIHQKNAGVVNARNKGLAIAKGEFLAFVDSDDYIETNMLEEMIGVATDKKLDIVWCDIKALFYTGEKISDINIFQDSIKNIKGLIADKIPGWLPIKIIRKDYWDRCNIITDDSAVIYEDTFISIQLMKNNPAMQMVKKPLYNYVRTNENSATNGSNIIKAEKSIILIHEYLNKNGLYKECEKEFTDMALKFKIQILKHNIDKAFELFPFSHKKLKNFKFPFITSLFYWFAFNTGTFGKILFKQHFK